MIGIPFINVVIEIKEIGQEESWIMEVDNDGECTIKAPCGEKTNIVPGRKGQFFKNILKAYEKAAKAAGIFDSKIEDEPI